MNLFTRLSNGWKISMDCFKVLKANKQLILLPVISGCALLVVMASFVTGIVFVKGSGIADIDLSNKVTNYIMVFVFYLVNYFIIVFFNMALIHCVRAYFRGEEVNLREGLEFSFSRIAVIFMWAVFAATIGTILKVIQENSGWLGKIITGIIGIVWNIATFFVVPVIAYENLGPIAAFTRSSQIMKQKWGESLAGNFSFGLVQFLGILIISLPLFFLGALVSTALGIVLAVLAAFIIISIVSAAQTVFTAAVYFHINGEESQQFNHELIDDLFVRK